MKLRTCSVFTILVITIGSIANKILYRFPETALPSPKQQLNTNFEESKVIFKMVKTNDISVLIFIICTVIVGLLWFSFFKKKEKK